MTAAAMTPVMVGQVWEHRDPRRARTRHRVLWVSDCGQYVRVIRCGGWRGRYVRAARLYRDYERVADA